MAGKPDAFLSYTRFDDENDGGAISEFGRRLANAVRAQTGEPFEIFQDVDGIGLGERWRGKLDEVLDRTRFFIPIVTPSYFTSKACRDELQKFLRAEAERGRDDLVLPIYYIESEVLEEEDLRAADPLARIIHERQRQDWRDLRFEPFDAKEVRRELERLARQIMRARRRSMLREPAISSAEPTAPAALTSEPSTVLRRSMLHDLEMQDSLALRHQAVPSRPETLRPGTVFRDVDAQWCPEMVVLPAGRFRMGSPRDEEGRDDDEGPQHEVTIGRPFALGKYPVTFEEYDHFCRESGREPPGDEGWGRGRGPVINVSWEDAKAYVAWMSETTSHSYRLPSEAEREYACRPGTQTRYWWGDAISSDNANYGKKLGRTSEVGTYAANPWGLHDVHGNVFEWVEDRWHNSYEGAPTDGSAWVEGSSARRVLRGGSGKSDPRNLRSADRVGDAPGARGSDGGFRLARTLPERPAVRPPKSTDGRKSEYHNPALFGGRPSTTRTTTADIP